MFCDLHKCEPPAVSSVAFDIWVLHEKKTWAIVGPVALACTATIGMRCSLSNDRIGVCVVRAVAMLFDCSLQRHSSFALQHSLREDTVVSAGIGRAHATASGVGCTLSCETAGSCVGVCGLYACLCHVPRSEKLGGVPSLP